MKSLIWKFEKLFSIVSKTLEISYIVSTGFKIYFKENSQ